MESKDKMNFPGMQEEICTNAVSNQVKPATGCKLGVMQERASFSLREDFAITDENLLDL